MAKNITIVQDMRGNVEAHGTGCRDIRDADPIDSVEELRELIEEGRHVFPCAQDARQEVK